MLPAGSPPRGLAFVPSRQQLLVTSSGDNSVLIFDLSDLTLAPRVVTSVVAPGGIAVDDVLGLAVVTNTVTNQVTIIDLATRLAVDTISVESTPWGVDINAATHVAVVSNFNSSSLSLIDLKTRRVIGTISDVPSSDNVAAVAVNSATNTAVVASRLQNSVRVIDLASRALTNTFPVGADPVAVAVNPVNNTAVAVNASGRSLTLLDLGARTTTELTQLSLNTPQGVAIHLPSNTAIVASLGSSELVFVDLFTLQVTGRVTSIGAPTAVATTPAAREAAAVIPANNNMAVVTFPAAGQFTVVSAADFATPVAAGSLASGFGTGLSSTTEQAAGFPLPTTLGGITVRVAGVDAPLIYVSPLQVNFQVPNDLSGRKTVQVIRSGVTIATDQVEIVTSVPALFTLNGAGTGPAAAVNEDGSIVTADGCVAGGTPAPPDTVVELFGTGQGPLTPVVSAGQAAPADPLSATPNTPVVTLGGVSVTVEFSGAAPSFAGLWQINIRIPKKSQNPPSGPAVPLVVTLNGRSSPPFATLAVNTTLQTCTK